MSTSTRDSPSATTSTGSGFVAPQPRPLGWGATSSPSSSSAAPPIGPLGARRTRRTAPPRYPSRPRESLQRKLFLRESFGQIRSSRRPTGHEVTSKLFSRLPVRLAFCLKDAVPLSAIEAGHIFLGFSKCGQFLLSYTQSTSDIDLVAGPDLSIKYNYRLHWWLFVPYRRAKKVAEVLLFSNGGVYGSLHLSFCQWPGDWTKLVVYGSTLPDFESGAASRPCYLTVTAVPSLAACKDCGRVAASYEDEDVAEAWNSCVRLSCLKHGATVHTTFDLVPPYPSFEPSVSLKRDNHILINTGNLLHSFHIQLETIGSEPLDDVEGTVTKEGKGSNEGPENYVGFASLPMSSPSQGAAIKWSELQVGTAELAFHAGDVFSPPMCSPGSAVHYTSDSETTDCESEHGGGGNIQMARRKAAGGKSDEAMQKVAQFVEKLTPPSPHRKFILSRRAAGRAIDPGPASTSAGVFQCHSFESLEDRLSPGADSAAASSIRRSMAEKAYELTDDDFAADGVREKLSTFRKKRLAEKTYEFTDEDLENVTPLPRLRSQAHRQQEQRQRQRLDGGSCSQTSQLEDVLAKSPRSEGLDEQQVLRQIQATQASVHSRPAADEQLVISSEPTDADVAGSLLVDSMAAVPELLSPGGMMKKDQQQSVMMSPRSSCGGNGPTASGPPPRFHTKFTRRFFETDGEMISVVTDVEEDDLGGTYCSSGQLAEGNAGGSLGTGGLAGDSSTAATYHTVLPLEVHGSGYQPMFRISNARTAERVGQQCVKVTQRTFDLEVFCYQMAQKLCQAAGKKYWFCNDYDVEVVDLDPASGDVVLVAVVLVSATVFTKKVSARDKCAISSLHRLQYQASFRFCWNIDSGQSSVIDSEPLTETGAFPDSQCHTWHPARAAAASLRRAWNILSEPTSVKCFTNDTVINGTSLKTIVDPDHLLAIIQDDLA